MNARDLTAALGGRWHGSCGMTCCPAHPDHEPSLSIADGEGGRCQLTRGYAHSGLTRSGRPKVACRRYHPGRLTEVRGALAAGAAPREADDRGWFELHPCHSHRCRAAYPDEPAAVRWPDGAAGMIVRQVALGRRPRRSRPAAAPPPDDGATLHAPFDPVHGSVRGRARGFALDAPLALRAVRGGGGGRA